MKTLIILPAAISFAMLMSLGLLNAQDSKKIDLKSRFIGTWQLRKCIYNDEEQPIGGVILKKFNSDGTFGNAQRTSGHDESQLRGQYFICNDSIFSEWVQENIANSQVNHINTFFYTIRKDTLTMRGNFFVPMDKVDNAYFKIRMVETWVKVKKRN